MDRLHSKSDSELKRKKNIADQAVTIKSQERHSVQFSNLDFRASRSNVLLYSKHECVASSLLPLDSSARLLVVQNMFFVLAKSFMRDLPCLSNVYMLLLESSMRFISSSVKPTHTCMSNEASGGWACFACDHA